MRARPLDSRTVRKIHMMKTTKPNVPKQKHLRRHPLLALRKVGSLRRELHPNERAPKISSRQFATGGQSDWQFTGMAQMGAAVAQYTIASSTGLARNSKGTSGDGKGPVPHKKRSAKREQEGTLFRGAERGPRLINNKAISARAFAMC
jgi:hypothetical protein